jgi:hypothetical protein
MYTPDNFNPMLSAGSWKFSFVGGLSNSHGSESSPNLMVTAAILHDCDLV